VTDRRAILGAMSTVTGWFPLVLTTFFGGAVGALVTTYGSQTGERRKVRSRARTELHQASSAGFRRQSEAQLIESLNDFEITAMLAGLPEGWVQLYTAVLSTLCLTLRLTDAEGDLSPEWRRIMEFLTRELTIILANATWHPWRTRVRHWYLVRRYRQVYTAMHVSIAKGFAAANNWNTREQYEEYFDFHILDRKRQRELIRFSRNTNSEQFVARKPPAVHTD
jgi:hypothetical protein